MPAQEAMDQLQKHLSKIQHLLITSILTWLLCANVTNSLHTYNYSLQPFLTFDIDCVIPVNFGSSTYTVGEKQRSLRGTLETPAYYPRSFTVYVIPHSTNANATGECHGMFIVTVM